eukprot:CAMPEP_0173445964 /NCGR_PEP_ID=MMETSP1357-20121228/35551_1 /TAXON_ID=77926 /ORGANISM="Hemiselmis rufescens, Strain PCC563" /LENGTH=175 /DNA_ID=CAMNT_0014412217 /DNA_START=306 /DNA_END=833 /DNA_ORIENTATION=+
MQRVQLLLARLDAGHGLQVGLRHRQVRELAQVLHGTRHATLLEVDEHWLPVRHLHDVGVPQVPVNVHHPRRVLAVWPWQQRHQPPHLLRRRQHLLRRTPAQAPSCDWEEGGAGRLLPEQGDYLLEPGTEVICEPLRGRSVQLGSEDPVAHEVLKRRLSARPQFAQGLHQEVFGVH